MKGPLLPSQFTATEWCSEQDKADFGNSLLNFIDAGFKQTLFTKKLYNRLSMTFGHIAHYDQHGFWCEWFTTAADHVLFLEHMLRYPCFGDPKFTFSDVERAVKSEVMARDYLFRCKALADAALRTREVAILETLEAKYRRPPPITCVEAEPARAVQPTPTSASASAPSLTVQYSLFE